MLTPCQLLLRLEKYPHRMNFEKGILESRVQTYGHLEKLLKPIPLDTPTEIELTATKKIRVTLLDANHCTGAVMFFFEGSGKAALYTGDVRAEQWWVKQIARHPVLIPYATNIRPVDRIYLDTTFATKEDVYRQFPTKSQGIEELIQEIRKYPNDTKFHFDPWTFGYEEVWIALASTMDCKIHVDRYRFELYNGLAKTNLSREAAALCGFQLGNRRHDGCLTQDPNTRFHSCERGTSCAIIENDQKVVRILPIISCSSDGTEVNERDTGGGLGDLKRSHELEITDAESVKKLMSICASSVRDPIMLTKALDLLKSAIPSGDGNALALTAHRRVALESSTYMPDLAVADMTLHAFADILAEVAEANEKPSKQPPNLLAWNDPNNRWSTLELPDIIVRNPHIACDRDDSSRSSKRLA